MYGAYSPPDSLYLLLQLNYSGSLLWAGHGTHHHASRPHLPPFKSLALMAHAFASLGSVFNAELTQTIDTQGSQVLECKPRLSSCFLLGIPKDFRRICCVFAGVTIN